MLIWIVLAVVLVVLVAGGFVDRARRARRREEAVRGTNHRGGGRNHRGRGRNHRGRRRRG